MSAVYIMYTEINNGIGGQITDWMVYASREEAIREAGRLHHHLTEGGEYTFDPTLSGKRVYTRQGGYHPNHTGWYRIWVDETEPYGDPPPNEKVATASTTYLVHKQTYADSGIISHGVEVADSMESAVREAKNLVSTLSDGGSVFVDRTLPDAARVYMARGETFAVWVQAVTPRTMPRE